MVDIRNHPVASAFAFLSAASPALAQPVAPVVSIESVRLAGRVDDGVASRKGIPFAAAPGGEMPWRATRVSAYVANFARSGNPNGAGLPDWPNDYRSTDELMDFAEDGKALAGKDPSGSLIDAAPASTR